jgi:hypothetical protein
LSAVSHEQLTRPLSAASRHQSQGSGSQTSADEVLLLLEESTLALLDLRKAYVKGSPTLCESPIGPIERLSK